MATSFRLLFLSIFSLFIACSIVQTSFKPKALVLLVTKDVSASEGYVSHSPLNQSVVALLIAYFSGNTMLLLLILLTERTPRRVVSVSNFLFICGLDVAQTGLASGVTDGVMLFGDDPYNFGYLNSDISKVLTFTPLIINPVSTRSAFLGEPSTEFFIVVKSIRISDQNVALNTTLLSIDRNGIGGTNISIANPYTVMETTIYENEEVVWSIIGANSMVQFNDVICLGFGDAGSDPSADQVGAVVGGFHLMTSITIGANQLENNMLQFDLATSRLGFCSLFLEHTDCANFNFTSSA
ncbi:hypothetical protein JHK85_057883 [Glycine max]|nr:hypothetical protein JHK86_056862 [Glycine max]KAG4919602.1 hypothetical protein JHK85_057883 [Glycine max]